MFYNILGKEKEKQNESINEGHYFNKKKKSNSFINMNET